MRTKRPSTPKKRVDGFAEPATLTKRRGQAPFPTTIEMDRRRFKSGTSTKARARMRPAPPPSDQLIGYLAEYDLRVGELALALRDMVLQEAPEAAETVFRGYVVSTAYSLTGKWTEGFCHIAVYPRHVNLGFNRGAELEDPRGLLIGSGKIIRHLKVAEQNDLKKPYLRGFIKAAIKYSKAELAERVSQLYCRSVGKAATRKRSRG